MKFDRNTVIGFGLLAIMLFGFFYFNSKEKANYMREQARKDSIANASRPKPDTLAQKQQAAQADSADKQARAGNFTPAITGEEKLIITENDLMRVAFSTKGGQPRWVELKHFKSQDSSLVMLANSGFDHISYPIVTAEGKTMETNDLLFNGVDSTTNADGSKTIRLSLLSHDSSSTTAAIVHSYTIRKDEYMMDFDVKLNNVQQLLPQGQLNLTWAYQAAQQESDLTLEKRNTQVGFVENEDFDFFNITSRTSINFSKPVSWIGVRQRFFNSILISKDKFNSGNISWVENGDKTKKTISDFTSNMKLQLKGGGASFQLFYGPADYHLLRKYGQDMDKLINLGQSVYAFVRPLNKYVVMPVWDFIKGFVGNYGLVIALLTLFIRLLISPLSYKSYLSSAKMKALRPEIAQLKEKFGGDQQAMSMEQMKLFREAGVNPLGGCIPALLQIPIFFALYSFFNANVDLRGAGFLWANDLSAFDDVIKFGVEIPLLGNHLSIFTLTAVLTSLAISIYSMNMSPDQSNPVLKYMPYIFPVFLLFIFNTLPAALTWYYTVSNLITLLLQFVIQNYIIDHNKILAQIAENRKKPKTKSKWQERLEQMQEQQKKVKEMQQKGKR
ncbi:MAG: membrane protein insertase YidC [Sphingobacteriales bacterium]|nr:membrane protein insertase YidC [Sphingobacteriales bacterium]OJW35144.1 MAG: hypothetical protein BGO54_03075 [Sphingobacteriales bacterium 46-32]